MDAEPKQQKAKRRDFLKLVGLGGIAGSAALATGVRPAPAPAQETAEKSGYRETGHIRKYYQSAKF